MRNHDSRLDLLFAAENLNNLVADKFLGYHPNIQVKGEVPFFIKDNLYQVAPLS